MLEVWCVFSSEDAESREEQRERIQFLESENESLRQKLYDTADQLQVLASSVQELEKSNQDKTKIQKHQNEVKKKITLVYIFLCYRSSQSWRQTILFKW